MDAVPYENREIDRMNADVMSILTRIETQTIRTNGRVSKLEQWKYVGMGATFVITALVVPLLSWALYTLSNLDRQIHDSVNSAMKSYTK